MRSLPLSLPAVQKQVDELLGQAGLRREALDYYAGLFCGEQLMAGGGYSGNTMKCIAVLPEAEGLGLINQLVTHLRQQMQSSGIGNIFVFTKPRNLAVFQNLAFTAVAATDDVLFLESEKRGIARFCQALAKAKQPGRSSGIVMNCNPFTLGHLALIEAAAAASDTVHILLLQTEQPLFSFAARWQMLEAGTAHLAKVKLHAGGPYSIAAGLFPAYFLKSAGVAAAAQIDLDLTLFTRYLAPALAISRRFAGEEPLDALTAQYNERMQQILPAAGIAVEIIPRQRTQDGSIISASRVRALLAQNDWDDIALMVPSSTMRYLNQHRQELMACV